jgi:pilus retraction protein PilT
VNLVLLQAIKDKASDIHFEPFETEFKMRYRIDGVLYEMMPPPAHIAPAISSRIKVMANLDIAERRLPQDGRIELNVNNQPIDLRVSVLPTMFGESVVMRVLDRGNVSLDLDKLGMREDDLNTFRQLIKKPNGICIVTGPTGSGKTTTLASLIAAINERDSRHIITVEDPIEYDHPHGRSIIEQVEIGIDTPDFPAALRAAVRQAPDVIVIGEMRDPETMRIALSAAETGHLVFATVHTTDVAAAVSRIADGFPNERQNAVRQELAVALAAVLTQLLVPARSGGVVPVAELLMVGYGARQHIRKNALQHLNQEITITRKSGSFTLEESLARFVQTGVVDRSEAVLRAAHVEALESLLSGPRT